MFSRGIETIATYSSEDSRIVFKKERGQVFGERFTKGSPSSEKFALHPSFFQLQSSLSLLCSRSSTRAIKWLLNHRFVPYINEGKIAFISTEKTGTTANSFNQNSVSQSVISKPMVDEEAALSNCLLEAYRVGKTKEQVAHLISLAHHYLSLSKDPSKNIVSQYNLFFKSAKLFNAALAVLENSDEKDSHTEQSLLDNLEKIEIDFVKKHLPPSGKLSKPSSSIRDYRNILKAIRVTCESSIQSMESPALLETVKQFGDISIQIEMFEMLGGPNCAPLNAINQKELTSFRVAGEITGKFRKLIASFIEDAIRYFGTPKVAWAAFSMGSMARGEMCLYSDIEYGFLVEKISPEILDYFCTVSRFIQLRVINMGETEFQVFGDKEPSPTKNGFCLDTGGNTPLGVEELYQLICTPDQLAQFQTKKWMDGNIILTNTLNCIDYITGQNTLITQYEGKRLTMADQLIPKKSQIFREALALHLLQGHVEEFKPNLSLEKEQTGAFGVKKELYRPFQEILSSLCLFYKVQKKNSLDKIDALVDLRIFSEEGGKQIKEAMALVLKLRLCTHQFYGNEEEFLVQNDTVYRGNVLTSDLDTKDFYLDGTMRYQIKEVYKILFSFHEAAKKFLKTQDKGAFLSLETKEKTKKELLQEKISINAHDIDSIIKLGQIEQEEGNDAEALRRFLQALKITIQSRISYVIYVNLLSECYDLLGDFYSCLDGKNESVSKIEHESEIAKMPKMYISFLQLESPHKQALLCYGNALAIKLQALKKIRQDHIIRLENHASMIKTYPLKIFRSFKDIAKCYYKEKMYEQAILFYKKAIEFSAINVFEGNLEGYCDNQIAFCQQHLMVNLQVVPGTGKYSDATNREDYTRKYEEKKRELAASASLLPLERIGDVYFSLAVVYEKITDWQEAIACCEKAAIIFIQIEDSPYEFCFAIINELLEVAKQGDFFPKTTFETLSAHSIKVSGSHTMISKQLEQILLCEGNPTEEECEKRLKELTLSEDDTHPKLLPILYYLSDIYASSSQIDKFIQTIKRALYIEEQLHGSTDSKVAEKYYKSGLTLFQMGQSKEAVCYFEKAAAIFIQIEKSPYTQFLKTLYDLLVLTQQFGFFPKSTLERLLEHCNKFLEPDNSIREQLSEIIFCEGKPIEETIEEYEGQLEQMIASLGAISPSLLPILDHLAKAYTSSKQIDKFLSMEKSALSIREKIDGDKNQRVARHYNDIGATLYQIGQFKEALAYFEKVLEIRGILYEENHKHLAQSHAHLGHTLKALEQPMQAMKHYQSAISILENNRKINEQLGSCYEHMSDILIDLRQIREGIAAKKKALEIMIQALGEEHPTVAQVHMNVGYILKASGDLQGGYDHYEKALKIRLKKYGKMHPDVAKSYNSLGSSTKALGNIEEGLTYFKKSLKIRLALYGEIHSEVAQSYHSIGATYFALGQSKLAIQHMEQAISIQAAIYGKYHPELEMNYLHLMQVLEGMGQEEAAQKYLQKAARCAGHV